MRIAYITETWPPEVNGVALTAARVVHDLRERGHIVQVVRPRQTKQEVEDDDTILVRGVPLPMYRDLRFGLPAGGRLEEAWIARSPDVVHIATEGPLGWSACSAAHRLGIPVTSDFRTRFDQYGAVYAWSGCVKFVRHYLRLFHNRTLCTFVPTEEVRADLARHGFRNLVVSGRGVDTVQFSPRYRSAALRRLWDAKGPVVLYVGRLAAEKNLRVVVSAFEAIRALQPEAKLVFVGDGPMRDQLEARCPYALFAGVQRGESLATYYASSDIFLFPSLTETFGNVTLEAMASGLAVVAFDTAAAALHIRDGENGLVSRPGDVDAFIHAAASVALDEGLRHRIGAAARMEALSASWERVLADFESELRYAKSRFREHPARARSAAGGVSFARARDTARIYANRSMQSKQDANRDIAALLAECLATSREASPQHGATITARPRTDGG